MDYDNWIQKELERNKQLDQELEAEDLQIETKWQDFKFLTEVGHKE